MRPYHPPRKLGLDRVTDAGIIRPVVLEGMGALDQERKIGFKKDGFSLDKWLHRKYNKTRSQEDLAARQIVEKRKKPEQKAASGVLHTKPMLEGN